MLILYYINRWSGLGLLIFKILVSLYMAVTFTMETLLGEKGKIVELSKSKPWIPDIFQWPKYHTSPLIQKSPKYWALCLCFFLLRPPTKWCYLDVTIHALNFFCKSFSWGLIFLIQVCAYIFHPRTLLLYSLNSLCWQKIRCMHRDVTIASFYRRSK